jgi:pyruvate kinase
VKTFVTPSVDTTDEMIQQVDQAILNLPGYEIGDTVIVVAGSSSRESSHTCLIRVHRLGHQD